MRDWVDFYNRVSGTLYDLRAEGASVEATAQALWAVLPELRAEGPVGSRP